MIMVVVMSETDCLILGIKLFCHDFLGVFLIFMYVWFSVSNMPMMFILKKISLNFINFSRVGTNSINILKIMKHPIQFKAQN